MNIKGKLSLRTQTYVFNGRDTRATIVLALTCLLDFQSALGQIPCRYELRFVEENFCGPSGTPLSPRGMNDLNPPTVAGVYHACPGSDDRPFYWRSNQQQITPMELPPGSSSAIAEDVNNVAGKLGVGQIVIDAPLGLGYLWNDGTWVSIPPPPSESGANPHAVAGSELVVAGTSNGKSFKAFRWDGLESTVLTLPYGIHQFGTDVSPDGTKIAGYMQESTWVRRAFIWDNGVVTDPGWMQDSTLTSFRAVNDFGEAAGGVRVPEKSGKCAQVTHAAVWQDNELIDIGVLEPYFQSGARDMNNAGIVIGVSQDITCSGGGGLAAFIWSAELGMIDLSTLVENPKGVFLPPCVAINERGEITCLSYLLGSQIAVLLTPMPRNGDVNCDGATNVDDLLGVVNSWGPCRGCQADLNEDWVVNVDDLLDVINHWSP